MRAKIEIECDSQEELELLTARLSGALEEPRLVQLPLFADQEPAAEPPESSPEPCPESSPEPCPESSPKPPPESTGSAGEAPPVTPSVMAKAKELGVEGRLAEIPRSGKGGRMTQGDVIAFAKLHGAPAAPPPEPVSEQAEEEDPFAEEAGDPFNAPAVKIPATVEQLQQAFRDLDKVKGTQPVLDILGRLGYRRVHEVPKEKWGDAVAMINSILAGVVI